MMLKKLERFSKEKLINIKLPQGTKTKQIRLQNQNITYILRKTKRRTVGITVYDAGLRVNAPNWLKQAQIDAAIQKHDAWILQKMQERLIQDEQQSQAEQLLYKHHKLPYMGVYININISPEIGTTYYTGDINKPSENDCLYLALPSNSSLEDINNTIEIWLKQQAKLWFKLRLNHFIELGDYNLHSWGLSNAKSRWGSCNTKKRILLNWRLMHYCPQIIDYVIAHEVAHIKELNHSPKFWQEVKRLMPNYIKFKQKLANYTPSKIPLL